MKAIKSDSDEQKKSPVFQKKINKGDTAELTETVMKKGGQVFRKKMEVAAVPPPVSPTQVMQCF